MKGRKKIKYLIAAGALMLVSGIGALVYFEHNTAAAMSEPQIQVCKEETVWYFRTENGIAQKRQWSYTYGKWVTDWINVAKVTPIPTEEPIPTTTISTPIIDTGNKENKDQNQLTKTTAEILNGALKQLQLDRQEWNGEILNQTDTEAILMLYPIKMQVSIKAPIATFQMKDDELVYFVSVKQENEELIFVSSKESGLSQAGIYAVNQNNYIGLVFKEDSSGWERYGMKWFYFDEAQNQCRICSFSERTDGLYLYWNDRKPVLNPDGTLEIYKRAGKDDSISDYLNQLVMNSDQTAIRTPEYIWEPEANSDISEHYLNKSYLYRSRYGITAPEAWNIMLTAGNLTKSSEDKKNSIITEVFVNEEFPCFTVYQNENGKKSISIYGTEEHGAVSLLKKVSADQLKMIHFQSGYSDTDSEYPTANDYFIFRMNIEKNKKITEEKQVFRLKDHKLTQTFSSSEAQAKYSENADVEMLPITEEYFASPVFVLYIKEHFDKDQDGFLSKAEREQADKIIWNFELRNRYAEMLPSDASGFLVMDGLNWFPNLAEIELITTGSYELYLDHHPGIKAFYSSESGNGLHFADHCENLENIWFCTARGMQLYVDHCPKLKKIGGYEYDLYGFYVADSPNVLFHYDYTIGIRSFGYLDANARIAYDETNFNTRGVTFKLDKDGIPREYRFDSFDTLNWIGTAAPEFDFAERIQTMEEMQNETAGQLKKEGTVVLTSSKLLFYSPNKSSVFCFHSRQSGTYEVSLLLRYYVLEKDSSISYYNSFDELKAAAPQIQGLENFEDGFNTW